jgi:hypothetical protein
MIEGTGKGRRGEGEGGRGARGKGELECAVLIRNCTDLLRMRVGG